MPHTSPLQDPQLNARLRRIRLLALDVDGVLTDGQLYFQADGIEIKAFNVQDGHGLKLLKRAGIQVALITGRESPTVTHRAAALGISHVFQGIEKKLPVLRELTSRLGLELDQVAYCGDDMPDVGAIRRAGVGISVPNAPTYIQKHADWVTERSGGQGVAREIADTLLRSQGHWDAVVDTYLHGAG
uniref:KdsC family phosphatase n=1 Tax=uncultured Halomonas sp. TaxID=173971 RepID=UPI00261CFBBE|nr:HAD hydrolase family protein [uncultured Halomonas sp.]